MRKHIINAVTGILLASLFLWLTLRNQPINDIFLLIREARLKWILLSLAMLLLIFVLRSIRWKLLLNNTGANPKLSDVAYSLLLGVFINSFTPKLGEVVRCTSLQISTGIKTSKSLGTVISERVYDLLTLLAGILLILLLESERLGSLVVDAFKNLFENIGSGKGTFLIYLAIGILLVIIVWQIVKRSGISVKIKTFVKGVLSTARMTFKIKNSRNFAIQTILIWCVMILMNYGVLRSLPSTDSLSLYFAMVTLFIGTIGWAIPSPGGIGTTHFFVLQLFILFNLNEETGIAYAVLVNGLQVVFTIITGFLAVSIVSILRFIRKRKAARVNISV